MSFKRHINDVVIQLSKAMKRFSWHDEIFRHTRLKGLNDLVVLGVSSSNEGQCCPVKGELQNSNHRV